MSEYYEPAIVIDRDSDEPLYKQIAEPIEQAILSGELASGARIEDEISMAQRLDVSRPTARRALQELVNRGLLTRRRGVGTTVTPPQVHRPIELTSLYDDLTREGFTPSTKVLSYDVHEADEEESDRLAVAPGTGVVRIARLRSADNRPLAVLTNLIPIDLAPSWTDLNEHGLYRCFNDHGIHIATAKQVIGARAATAEEAELLTEPVGAPLLTMSRTAYDATGRVVEYGNHIYRPSLYSFDLTLVAH
ncbi:GntR family transcriptional regulator [Raineyella sp. LH-20]|uniref:GntR family transcriptional regulator n=1 Tax=Raineyella sp. LH-20 TaxID=3081204 RepID=UPI00295505A4|nr:GntR family transcriptional regulator [Raineyella sp. LH-20]WOP19231.1 GntR family transcriptional regulator [Raineyella sp. LH-20]